MLKLLPDQVEPPDAAGPRQKKGKGAHASPSRPRSQPTTVEAKGAEWKGRRHEGKSEPNRVQSAWDLYEHKMSRVAELTEDEKLAIWEGRLKVCYDHFSSKAARNRTADLSM